MAFYRENGQAMEKKMRKVERYGKMVWENEEFEDQRRGNCLCHQCGRLKPGEDDNCEAAKEFFETCKKHGCAFILTRCGLWEPKTEDGEKSTKDE